MALNPIVFGAALLAMTGCGGLLPSISGIPSAPSGPVAGSFAAFGVDNYPYPFSPNNSLTNQSQIAISASLQLRQDGWTDVNGQAITDPLGESPTAGPGNQNVSVQSIQNAVNAGASLIVFAGHGSTGDIEFSGAGGLSNNDYQFWGVGSTPNNSSYSTPANTDSTGGSLAGHNLKWMVLSSSDTVAPDSIMDPLDNDPNFQVSVGAWFNFFDAGFPTATLRSLFGYWQSPGNCAQSSFDGSPRDCDVSVGPDALAVSGFLSQIWPYPYNPTGAPTMNSAWEQANQTAGLGNAWSIVQDCNANNDIFSSQNNSVGNPSLSGQMCFASPYTIVNNSLLPQSVGSNTFPLEPQALQIRPVNVPSLVQSAETYLPVGPLTVVDNGSVRRYTSHAGLTVVDYYAKSGGAVFNGYMRDNPLQFTQADALNAAVQYVQQTSGIPADASLSSIVPVYMANASAKSRVLIGYQFTWTHDNANISGGDAIIVDVDDLHSVRTVCTKHEVIYIGQREGFRGRPVVICVASQTTVSDTPGISYSYYLWREPIGRRPMSYAGRSTGMASVDAYTASLSLPHPKGVVAYTAGYWTGDITSSDNVEHPAWLFTTQTGAVIAVDAFSGKVLGERD